MLEENQPKIVTFEKRFGFKSIDKYNSKIVKWEQ